MKLDAIIRMRAFGLERSGSTNLQSTRSLVRRWSWLHPSDHRHGANTLAQLSRLTGIRKRELIAPPVRGARRNDTRLRIFLFHLKTAGRNRTEVQPTAPTPMDSSGKKIFEEDGETRDSAQLKLGRQRQRLQAALDRCMSFSFTKCLRRGGSL